MKNVVHAESLLQTLARVSPLAALETSLAARRPGTYLSRLQIAAPALAILLGALNSSALSGGSGGDWVLSLLTTLCVVGAILSGPFMTGSAFLREQREGTLGLLFITPLTSRQIIWAKMASHAMALGWNALAVAPLFSICFALGGVTPAQFATSVVLVLGVIFLAVSTSLLASVTARSSLGGMTQGFLRTVAYLLFGVIPAVILIGQLVSRGNATRNLKHTEPSAVNNGDWLPGLAAIVLTVIVAAVSGNPVILSLCFPAAGLAGGVDWILGFHLVMLFLISVCFLECARAELELKRRSGGFDVGGSGEKLASGDDEVLASRGDSPVLKGRLMQMDSSALALGWAGVALYSIRAFVFAGMGPSLAQAVLFDSARVFVALIFIPFAWHVCRSIIKLKRSGIWELLRASPMEDQESLQMIFHAAFKRALLKPLVFMQLPGLAFLLLMHFATTDPMDWFEIALYAWTSLRTILLAQLFGWHCLANALGSEKEISAFGKAWWWVILLPWLVCLSAGALWSPTAIPITALILDVILWVTGRIRVVRLMRRPFDPDMALRAVCP